MDVEESYLPLASAARAMLGLLMMLELGGAVFLVLAHQRFLENRSLVGLVVWALVGIVIVSFLQGLVPGFLVSITDAVAALIVAIVGAIWAFVLLLRSLPGVVRALRVDRAA